MMSCQSCDRPCDESGADQQFLTQNSKKGTQSKNYIEKLEPDLIIVCDKSSADQRFWSDNWK
jgi:hypothetical protein